nr:antifungal protein [Aspergillus niger CBS 513.88]|eukprot:XP_003188705.1 antifungal protein [Aspergillus niger CBS 513.88]
MQLTSIAIILFAAMGAIANPIAAEADNLVAREAELSKYGGECSVEHNTCTYLKGGKDHICKTERHHCEYDEHHKTVDCQTPV